MAITIPYKCSVCKAENYKLWRQYQMMLSGIRLMCGPCTLTDQKAQGPIDADGFVYDRDIHQRCDQIGWLVPAVPSPDGSFWGYTSVPPADVAWWRALPSYPNKGAY